jgi:uncharacterized cupin superfamily protein
MGHPISSVLFHKMQCRIGKLAVLSQAGVCVRSTSNGGFGSTHHIEWETFGFFSASSLKQER